MRLLIFDIRAVEPDRGFVVKRGPRLGGGERDVDLAGEPPPLPPELGKADEIRTPASGRRVHGRDIERRGSPIWTIPAAELYPLGVAAPPGEREGDLAREELGVAG